MAYQIFYSPIFGPGFRLDASESRLYEPKFNYILPFLYEIGKVSIIYHKYSKLFIEITPRPVSCTIGENTQKYLFNLNLNNFFIFSLVDYSCFFGSVMKNCVFNFEKDLLFTRN